MYKRQYYTTSGLVLLIVLVVLNLPDQKAARLKLAISGIFLPLFGIAGSAQQLAGQAGKSVASRNALLNETDQLRKENQELRQQLMQIQDAWRENAQLRQALGWQKRVLWQLKPARVVGHDPANWWRTMLIDVGTNDGIHTGMAVLSAEGLVGRITDVGFSRSRVVLVGDPSCRFAAQVQEARDSSIVAKGIIEPSASSFNRLLVNLIYVPGGSLLKPGQTVMTSGDGGVFQKGILVGQVVDVRTNDFGLNLEARVKLAANLNRLEFVWVLTQ